jgi:serine/threonine-protein kinase
LQQGRFAEARAALQACAAQAPAGHPSRRPAATILEHCERLLALEPKLSAVARGESRPASAAEGFDYAVLCAYQRHYHAAARLSADALALGPELTSDPTQHRRYNAACFAALAGCGRGKDVDQLDDEGRACLRRQALDWLRADLVLWTKLAENNDPQVREVMRKDLMHWQADDDFAGVRDKNALAKLPDQEREAWQNLWAGVTHLLKEAPDKK